MVPPEELALLKQPNSSAYMPQFDDNLDIDINILGQLSEAGITIGRQIEVPQIEFTMDDAVETSIIQKLAEDLGCCDSQRISIFAQLFNEIERMVHDKMEANMAIAAIEKTVSIAKTEHESSAIECEADQVQRHHSRTVDGIDATIIGMLSDTVMDCLRACVNANTNSQRQQTEPDASYQKKTAQATGTPPMYEIISRVLGERLACSNHNEGKDISSCVMAIGHILATPIALQTIVDRVNTLTAKHQSPLAGNSMVDLLKFTINTDIYDDSQILMNLCAVLANDEEPTYIDTLRYLSDGDPKVLYDVMDHVRSGGDERLLDDSAAEALLKDSIVCAVQQSTDNIINGMFTAGNGCSSDSGRLAQAGTAGYLKDTMMLAKALGLVDCVEVVAAALEGERNDAVLETLKSNRSFELLQRVIVMHRLSKSNADWLKALELLQHDPYTARNESNLCDLLRLSTISSTMPSQRSQVTGTNAVPISLFYMNNQLLIEDFMMQKQVKTHGVFLICKDKYQAVVPRESSRDVLVGKCAYTMLDENGIRHFEPLHVYSALHVRNKPMLATRFSMYSCDFVDDHEDAGIDAMRSPILAPSTKLNVLRKHCTDVVVGDADGGNRVDASANATSTRNDTKSLFANRFKKQVCL